MPEPNMSPSKPEETSGPREEKRQPPPHNERQPPPHNERQPQQQQKDRQYHKRWPRVRIVIDYVLADNAKNKRSFAIGLATVVLVVSFLSLIQNALVRSGVVFLKLAESQAGAFDLVGRVLLTPEMISASDVGSSPGSSLNYTYVNATLQPLVGTTIQGVAPRWIVRCNVSAVTPEDGEPTTLSAAVLVLDTDLERSIGLASQWPYRTLNQEEVHVSASLLRALRIQPNRGQRVHLEIDIGAQLGITIPDLGGILGPQFSRALEGQNVTVDVGALVPDGQNGTAAADLAALALGSQVLLKEQLNATYEKGVLAIPAESLNKFLGPESFIIKSDSVGMQVIEAIQEPFGKFPPSIGNVVMLEKSYMEQLLREILRTNLDDPLVAALLLGANGELPDPDKLNVDEFAMSMAVVMRDRYTVYGKPTIERQAAMVAFSNQVMQELGVDFKATVLDVLNKTITSLDFIRIFLGEVFFTVIAVLVLLAIILITSLLLADAEEKTFEYGILRTLGLQQDYIVILLVFQSLLFSIPGVLIGLGVCYVLFVPLGYLLSSFSGSQLDLSLDPSAIVLGSALGLVMPIVGMGLPIRRALTKTIRDALDVYHNVVFGTTIKMQKLEDIGLSLTETVVSVLLVVGGFLVYYLIPLSFIYARLDLFFRIMTFILLGMVVGQLLLGLAFQPVLQQAAVRLVTFTSADRRISKIIEKNLTGHSGRNRKTSIMFTLCLGYLIFAATMFRLQSNSLSETLEWTSGADISIASPSLSLPLPEDELRTYLMAQRVNSDAITTDPQIVVDYTFTSFAINEFFPVLWAEIERPVNIKSISVKIYAVERNFLSVVLDRYCMTTELDHAVKFRPLPNGSPNVVAALYRNTAVADPGVGNILAIPATDPEAIALSVEGAVNFYREPMPVLVSEAARDRAFISTQNEAILEVGLRTDGVTSVTQTWLVQPIAMLKKFPAFMAVNRLVTKDTPLFVSMDWYGRILDSIEERANTTMNEFNGQELPKSQLFVRVTPGATALEIEALLNRINSILANDKFTATDLRSLVATTRTASDFIDVAFGIVAFVGIVLSFFVLLLSFIANIRENSWELGVLRAVGLSVNAVSRVYIYEALSIIFACVIVGTTLGVFTAVTLTIQFNLFTDMPFAFYFPWGLFAWVLVFSIIVAVYGSYYPTISFNRKPIAIVLRGA